MAEIEVKPAARPPVAPPSSAIEVIISSAAKALSGAFVFWILGGVAMSIAGSFAGDMVPSRPPGFAGASSEGNHGHAWWGAVQSNAFVLVFALFFVHSLWVGFHGKGGGPARRVSRILANLRENWFGLIVGNAIGAWVATLLLGLPNFSIMHLLWQWVLGLVLPLARQIGNFVLGSNSASVADWFSWYDANQVKLAFWFFYLAAALDDLGVPNFKTLARWGWRRMQKGKEAPVKNLNFNKSTEDM